MEAQIIKGHLDGLVLAVLSTGPGHGYEVLRRLASASGGVFDLPEGTLYPALHRLEEQGLLASSWQQVDGRRRRVYRLTRPGHVRLGERQAGWRRFAVAVDAVLGTGEATA